MYFPESCGIRSRSFRYQSELLRYGSNRRFGIFIPSFNHVYLRGCAPVAAHFSLIECDAGHALNDLFSKLGSVKTGAPKRRTKSKLVSKVTEAEIREMIEFAL